MSHQLRDLRRRIESLATPDGALRLACARTGERPVPAAGLRFEDRPTAEAAVRLASEYRDRLRAWDPRTPRYDAAVHERGPGESSRARRAARAPDSVRAPSDPASGRDGDALGMHPGDAE